MIKFLEGNIFESPAQTLVNTVNTVGAMGKGIAKDYKRMFPDMFKEYQELCESGEIDIGALWLYRTPHKWVLNFPTKKHWRQPSELRYIELGLQKFIEIYDEFRITSAAFPRLGCGNGELDWNIVKQLMEKYLGGLPIDIYIYEKHLPLVPEHKNIKSIKDWLISEPNYYPFEEIEYDIKNLIRTKNEFFHNQERFVVTESNIGTKFELINKSITVPWRGGEDENGWLEIWQFIREKKICTNIDLQMLGFSSPVHILLLLQNLKLLKEVIIHNSNVTIAIQLKPTIPNSNQPNLFNNFIEVLENQ